MLGGTLKNCTSLSGQARQDHVGHIPMPLLSFAMSQRFGARSLGLAVVPSRLWRRVKDNCKLLSLSLSSLGFTLVSQLRAGLERENHKETTNKLYRTRFQN